MSITQKQLEDLLWGAAVLLRGQIEASDYKQYIFPLLFYKRMDDVYQEEYIEALELYEDDELAKKPEQHRFVIPDNARWNVVQSTTKDVGKVLKDALRAIEKSNPRLYGVFGDAVWTNKERLPDHLLVSLINHFSQIPLGVKDIDQDDLGNACRRGHGGFGCRELPAVVSDLCRGHVFLRLRLGGEAPRTGAIHLVEANYHAPTSCDNSDNGEPCGVPAGGPRSRSGA